MANGIFVLGKTALYRHIVGRYHRPMKTVQEKSGFTLIELLVVIAIIGLLSSMTLASLNIARLKARDARRVADIRELQVALELYYNSQSVPEYPAASAVCDAAAAYGLEALVAGGFIPTIPRDPNAVPNCYRYTSNAASPRAAYHLGAALEEAANPTLTADKDCDSTDNNPVCAAGAVFGPVGTPFDGTAAPLYDIVP